MKPSELLTQELKWCPYAIAKNREWRECEPWAKGAIAWSAEGAMMLYTGLSIEQQILRVKACPMWGIWLADNARAEYRLPPELWAFEWSSSFYSVRRALLESNL